MRQFDTGATRDGEEGKLDYDGFLSPLVLHRFAQYMHAHRRQADGKPRASSNWKKGIPINTYMKSMWRHFMDVWLHYSLLTYVSDSDDIEDSLCALLFNVMGMLHEISKENENGKS